MKQAIALTALLLGTLVTERASAEVASGVVTSLGCHNVDDVCYVTLDGFPSSSVCNRAGQLRWDASTSWGKRWHAMFLTSQLTGRSVSLYVAPDYCGNQNFPTFVYGTMN